jgi:hypothetical protein
MTIKKFNYFYKIENTVNGKFYYGVHSTNDLNDNYFGSGKRLRFAIKKYGKENFIKENLLFFEKFNEALEYELKTVNENLIQDPSCYNLKKGGTGGNNGKGEDWYKQHYSTMGKIAWTNSEYKERHRQKQSILWKKLNKQSSWRGSGFKGKKHTEETKIKMKLHKNRQLGEKNSQYGTCWITNEKTNQKIHKGNLIPEGWRLGRKIKL